MKRIILFLIFSCIVIYVSAQEKINSDSIPKIGFESGNNQLVIDKPLIFNESYPDDEFPGIDKLMFQQPLIPDLSKKLDFKKYLGTSNFSSQSYSTMGFGFSPFYTNESIFNQATYKINDHFSFGGNSFGAQSIFEQPKLNSSINDMSTKGASMFMQYKISKNVKVETRISITKNQSPWEP